MDLFICSYVVFYGEQEYIRVFEWTFTYDIERSFLWKIDKFKNIKFY